MRFLSNAREVFGHSRVNILAILNTSGYMLTSSNFAFIHLRYILIDASNMIDKFPEVLNFNRLFLELSSNYNFILFSIYVSLTPPPSP